MKWSKQIPEESGWYYNRGDRYGWSIRWVDISLRMVYFGNECWSFEDYLNFGEEFGDKIGDPE